MRKGKLSATATVEPILRRPQRFGTIPKAIDYSGMGKSKLYDKAKERRDLMRKWDKRTLVDFDVLDEILDGLPTLHAEQS